jgi:hypothetical protein
VQRVSCSYCYLERDRGKNRTLNQGWHSETCPAE